MTTAQAIAFLDDPDREVRRGAQRLLYINRDMSLEDLLGLIDSRHDDVRDFVLSASRILPPEEGRKVLQELLIDDNETVRSQALSEYARRCYPDALTLLDMSLQDDSRMIKGAAISGLLALRTPEAQQVLKDFAAKTDDAELRNMARIGLVRQTRSTGNIRLINPGKASPTPPN
jgi:HEAT repeat protein